MIFYIKNKPFLSSEFQRTNTLLNAYYTIQNYPMHATEIALDNFLQVKYKSSLKNLCIKLLLNTTFYKDAHGNFVLLFKNPKYDEIAQLITYGNGVILGSKILKTALETG